MTADNNTPFRLHPTAFNDVRRAAARNGIAVNEGDIQSVEDYREAAIMGLDPKDAANLAAFIETGSYPGMEKSMARRAQEERELAAQSADAPAEPEVDELAARRAARRAP